MEKDLEDRLRFERLLSDLSAKYVRLQGSQVDKEIESDLIQLIEILNVDRCSLAQFSTDMKSLPVTHTFSVPGVALLTSTRLEKEIPWYTEKVRNRQIVNVPRVEDLPPEAQTDKAFLLKHKTKSNLVIPLDVGGALLGVLGMATTGRERTWPDDLIQRLKLTGEVFANALMRKRKEHELNTAFARIKELKDQLQAENIYLRDQIEHHRFKGIVGQSRAIRLTLNQVGKVAETDSTVLIMGETGTGKELLARAIHRHSKRKNRTMVKVNCAAIPPTLIESELFGSEKGAYTGAMAKRVGRFEAANGSTLFLDEISELPLELQAKLLRVLQEKQFERLGGNKTVCVDVRIIAATNQNLEEAVNAGHLRQDLYYRLNVFPIHMPPLRDRLEDIPLLIEAFVREFSEAMGKNITNISSRSLKCVMQYEWPGNVRELRNVVERAMIMSTGRSLQIKMPQMKNPTNSANLKLDDVIRNHLLDVLKKTNWKVSGKQGAAQILGLPPTTLESKMKKLGIRRAKTQM
jgi:transcriptional regulator with GAF, ATPase, and Fis domain